MKFKFQFLRNTSHISGAHFSYMWLVALYLVPNFKNKSTLQEVLWTVLLKLHISDLLKTLLVRNHSLHL